MSYVQELGELGAAGTPRVAKEFFRQALEMKKEMVKLYHKPQIINCPCWNPVYETSDPNCDQCKGTGKLSGFAEEPDAAFIAAVFLEPEVRQDQHQRLLTRVGPIETLDGVMFCEGRWWDTIKVGDVIVYKPRGRVTGTELRIISKVPRTANDGEIIFIRCDLEKQPSTEVYGSSVQETI